jgi:hypothetical protein
VTVGTVFGAGACSPVVHGWWRRRAVAAEQQVGRRPGEQREPVGGDPIGAFHQAGWTGLVADLIRRRHGEVEALGDVIGRIAGQARQ